MSYSVIHSVLSPQALQKTLELNYKLPQIEHIQYYQAGLNDTYLVRTKKQKFILRAYRKNWRTESDIRCELDAIIFLHKENINVSLPKQNLAGDSLIKINAPEGTRYLVLFEYLDGNPPEYKENTDNEVKIYAKAFGQLHKKLKSFNSTHSRFKLDMDYLITNPLAVIKPFLKHRESDWNFISHTSTDLLKQLPNNLQTGFCHGDLNTQNVHIQNNTIGIFDFDCCGYGYYAADLAAFHWGSKLEGKKFWPAFLDHYLIENPLNDNDINSINIFSQMRHIWHIGLHTQLSHIRGHHWINDEYFDKQIELLKNW